MASLLRTIFGCCLRGSETDQQDEPERQRLLEPPVDNTQTPPEVILSRGTVSDDQRNSALKQRLNNIVSNASHGMRSAPSQYGTYYGAASVSQNSSNVPPPQPPTGALGGTQVSRVGSRMSSASYRPHAQAPQARGAETLSAEVTPTPDVLPYSNLTHRVRTTLPGPGAGSSGASSSDSPDQQGLPRSARLDEEPERGRRMSGIKGVLDRPERRPSMVSPTHGSKPVSKDPYTPRESMDIPSPNGKSPSYAKTNGGVGSFKIPQDDELILQYD